MSASRASKRTGVVGGFNVTRWRAVVSQQNATKLQRTPERFGSSRVAVAHENDLTAAFAIAIPTAHPDPAGTSAAALPGGLEF